MSNKREYEIPEGYEARIYGNKVIIVPKESEDERIRKSIIGFLMTISSLKDGKTVCNEDFDSKAILEWVAWLEKQGEHARFIEAIQVGDQVTKNEDGVLVNLSQFKRVAKKDEKQGEQKPAWSEEDKRIIDNLVSQLCNLYTRKLIKKETKDKYVNWFKSLKDRYTWKPSEEQMKALKEAVDEHFDIDGGALWHLYEDLKKLMEEDV